MHSHGTASAQAERLEALRRKHSTLDRMVKEVQSSPAASDVEIKNLKFQKLKVKDAMEQIRRTA